MKRQTSHVETTERVKPIKWSNLVHWMRQTTKANRNNYLTKERPLSTHRLWYLVVPALQRPIFLIGPARSGTTFLGKCLATLPEVSYHFEPVITKAAARYVYEGIWSFRKAKFFYRQVYSWLMRIHLDGDLRFAEKTPNNCFLVSFLHKAFPDAQFIHIIRDGRDAALSHSKKPWFQAAFAGSGKREPGGYLYGPYAQFWVEQERKEEFETTSDIHRCIWAWRRFTESVLEQATNLPASQYYELRYEALVTNPKEEAGRLLKYLGIEDSLSHRLFHKAVARAEPNSLGGWQRELSSEQLEQIGKEAGLLLRKLGYLS